MLTSLLIFIGWQERGVISALSAFNLLTPEARANGNRYFLGVNLALPNDDPFSMRRCGVSNSIGNSHEDIDAYFSVLRSAMCTYCKNKNT